MLLGGARFLQDALMTQSLTTQPRRLLQRILDRPDLVTAVRALRPAALLRLVAEVGLEDAGELVSLATTEQLQQIFDEDLWQSARPGQDERFDGARFGLWLEVMLEAGEAFAADKLAEMSEDLVMMAFDQQLLVIDLDELTLSISGEDERALEDAPNVEIDNYRAIARRLEGWDALSTILGALDQRHPDLLRRILERLWRAYSEWIWDNGGLSQVLTSEEMLQVDAAADRDDRRSRSGYVSPSSAAAFLALRDEAGARDPLTQAYFRHYDAPTAAAEELAARAETRAAELLDLPVENPAPLLLEGELSPFRRALANLDEEPHAERMRELVYLANVLMAGGTLSGRRFRAAEAAETVLAVCERALAGHDLRTTPCDRLFRLGWKQIHDEHPHLEPNDYVSARPAAGPRRG
jgi:hypothetical protein